MISYIYKITDINNLVYYGSTFTSLNKRLDGHKNRPTCSSKLLDLDNCKIESVESFYYDYDEKKFHKEFLRKREQYYISNNECVNIRKAYESREEFLKRKLKHKYDNYEKICCRLSKTEMTAHSFNRHTKSKKHLSNIK